ncbi:hypothetical protein Y032_0337g2896 [Ancylostoma ceylanicum]|uniref:Integral membrane protein, C.elegans Sra family n=1 Tax=Ancylostoma ceylanicum TaxID=53326 RepID=A0A016RYE8_9BILA|nr:hypothetical protein Y032_0337g2896 [Ancylostoma ceylanicum]
MSVEEQPLSFIAFCVERGVATIFVRKYESNGIMLGLTLCALTIIGMTLCICTTYTFDDFKVATPSMVNVPPAAMATVNRLAVVCLVVSVVSIATIFVALYINKRRCSSTALSLTSRYQTRENVITTQFATHLASLQVTFFVIYGSGGLFARILGQYIFENNRRMYFAVRQILYVLPIFIFVLPIFSAYRLKSYRLEREKNIRSMVEMESRGSVGTRNYEEIIFKSWQAKANK